MMIAKRNALLLCIMLAVQINAQVTIGSEYSPSSGALLDLKELNIAGGGADSNKGLLLPRVMLKSLTIPSNGTNLATTINGTQSSDFWEQSEHVGLTVFNVVDDAECPTFPKGVYTWNGNLWVFLQDQELPDLTKFVDNNDGTGLLTDYEGNTYTTKVWNGKHWMTQNLRSVYGPDGSFIDCPNGVRLNPAYVNGSSGSSIVVKKSIKDGKPQNGGPVSGISYTNAGTVVTNQSYEDYAKIFGLYYNWDQAQRACPRGWHIPSPAEWNALAVTMGGTTITNPDGYTGIGHAMKTNNGKAYKPANHTAVTTWGVAGTTENGFNGLPTGFVGSPGTTAGSFTTSAFWWSNYTSGGTGNIYKYYSLIYSNSDFYEGMSGSFYYSVRCVQD